MLLPARHTAQLQLSACMTAQPDVQRLTVAQSCHTALCMHNTITELQQLLFAMTAVLAEQNVLT